MGCGIIHEELYSFADSIVNQNVDKHEHGKISKHVIDCLLVQHKNSKNCICGITTRPKQACQANSDT